MSQFDVFICHSGEHDDWVNAFSLNLARLGHKVFNDATVRLPGMAWPQKVYDAARSARIALIVVGGRAYEKHWVQNEYNLFLRRREETGFLFLPVLVDTPAAECPYPFLETMDRIDFRPPKDYRISYNELLLAIEGKPAGPGKPYEGELDIPGQAQKGTAEVARIAVDEVFEKLRGSAVAMLLSQAEALDGRFRNELLARARREYGEAGVMDVTLSPYPDLSESEFLDNVGRKLGFSEGTPSALELEDAITQRVRRNGPTMMFIGGLERCPEGNRHAIASVCRTLTESGIAGLSIVLKGGKNLADLCYLNGQLSLLNNAADVRWPEMTVDDVKLLASQQQGLNLGNDDATAILEESGGHPLLARTGIRLYGTGGQSRASLRRALSDSAEVAGLFGDVQPGSVIAQKLGGLVASEELGPWNFCFRDTGLDWAYWRNLATWSPRTGTGRVRWRCPAIHAGARRALEQCL